MTLPALGHISPEARSFSSVDGNTCLLAGAEQEGPAHNPWSTHGGVHNPVLLIESRESPWPKYRFRSGPPQILISKFRGAAANFEVDFDCQNTSVLPQDRAYRRRTPTQDIPPLNRTRSPPHETRLERAGAHESAFGGVGSAERYWRRDRASLRCVRRPSARRCADIATLPARSTLLPREGAGRV